MLMIFGFIGSILATGQHAEIFPRRRASPDTGSGVEQRQPLRLAHSRTGRGAVSGGRHLLAARTLDEQSNRRYLESTPKALNSGDGTPAQRAQHRAPEAAQQRQMAPPAPLQLVRSTTADR